MENPMYTGTMSEFKIKQDEMFRQAEYCRLVLSQSKEISRDTSILSKIGQMIGKLISQ